MRKSLSLIALTALLHAPYARADTLHFAAQVADEDLAEESILLLHCLAERSGSAWEFGGEIAGSHWLELKEKGAAVEGRYRHGETESAIRMQAGGAEAACEWIYPETKAAVNLRPVTADANLPDLPAAPPSGKAGYWPWALGAAAAVALGLVLLQSGKPAHRGLTMN